MLAWFSVRGVIRLSSGQFRVAGYNPDFDTDAEGVAVYQLAGSSNVRPAGVSPNSYSAL